MIGIKDVFRSFDSHEVRYVVIGGIAAILHGVPRPTFDLDVLIDPSPDNARRLLEALVDIGMGTASLTTPEEVVANVITIFKDRLRLDVQTSTPGITFAQVWERRERLPFHGQLANVLCKADLIASKLAAGRKVDLEDVQSLRQGKDAEGE